MTARKLIGFDLLKKLVSITVFYIFVKIIFQSTEMKDVFEGIAYLFEEILFLPFNMLRELEYETSWALANIINWLFVVVVIVAFAYWMKQLKTFNDNNEEDRDPTAHSFLG
jgi:hypothetical protein